ncbi:hypothetical protein GQ53DRAFT_826665 [Thozetella sp. PMI_491]|nr:hypothetical protein GQ53DRAFT_826665 [Thozetella sp. PMI_491]
MAPSSPSNSAMVTNQLGLRDIPQRVDLYTLPNEQELLALVTQFFATVGIALPYIDKVSLLSYTAQPSNIALRQMSRPKRALLNIVCAHAAFTVQSTDAELYYQRSLGSLDERTLRGASLELVQALLLVCSFQQNTQRSIESWSHHATVVKSALQLGLHSPSSYEDHGLQKRELRKRVWFAVVNQDRFLSVAMGRPYLIPPEHNRVDMPQDPVPNSLGMMNRRSIDSLVYYNHLM